MGPRSGWALRQSLASIQLPGYQRESEVASEISPHGVQQAILGLGEE